MDWALLQSEHKTWLDTNYPKQSKWMPACGMLEEAGELVAANLKYHQRQAFGTDSRGDQDYYADMVDSIGDCAIYCLSWCNTVNVNFYEIGLVDSVHIDATVQQLLSHLLRAATSLMETHWVQYAELYMAILRAVAVKLSVPFEEAIHATWQIVRTRKREPQAPAEAVS